MTDVTSPQRVDPRDLLSEWANRSDEWVRYIVRHVLNRRGPLDSDELSEAYVLFRQENAFDTRELPTEEPLIVLEREDETIEPLTLTSLSHVVGVNALVEGAVIKPDAGLTILFGENGTGKTGYSRIFKALAASRTADVILGDIGAASPQPQSALIGYPLGTETKTYTWTGQQGVAPFTRMSIFDSSSVGFHIDKNLGYVYIPASLALFDHVIAGIKSVKARIERDVESLRSRSTDLLPRFSPTATVYRTIEALGASTDLEHLRSLANSDPDVETRIGDLRSRVAVLEADAISTEIKLQQRVVRVLTQASEAATVMADFDVKTYDRERGTLQGLEEDYSVFRTALFQAAGLPAEPDDTWSRFIEAGEAYQAHLIEVGAHDVNRCLYCRQPLNEAARSLIGKYSEYLEDKITKDIAASKERLRALTEPVTSIQINEVSTFVDEYAGSEDRPDFYLELNRTLSALSMISNQLLTNSAINTAQTKCAASVARTLGSTLKSAQQTLDKQRTEASTKADTLTEKKKELVDLEAAAELSKSWTIIESQVNDAKDADRLALLAEPMPGLLRAVTKLAMTASDQMINESFEKLFSEECTALRAPAVSVEFLGRQGRAQRRKVLSGNHKPSEILSEGEQKVLAMADFLAEARLAWMTAPVIFDDPVSSLDHRRINEVAQRVASLADTAQVIVFTHDIFFASTLLALMESTKHCSYFQITDEEGKGKITRATGPRWDTLKNIKKRINETIQEARSQALRS